MIMAARNKRAPVLRSLEIISAAERLFAARRQMGGFADVVIARPAVLQATPVICRDGSDATAVAARCATAHSRQESAGRSNAATEA